MRWILLLFLAVGHLHSVGQGQQSTEERIEAYLDQIRQDRVRLRLFFQQMPKGGDLHHHFSGSVYAETYLDFAEKENYWVHSRTFAVKRSPKVDTNWVAITTLQEEGTWPVVRERILRKWSTKEYQAGTLSPAEDFFEPFLLFDSIKNRTIRTGLLELKQRALEQQVSYIETQFDCPRWKDPFPKEAARNKVLLELANASAEILFDSLENWYDQYLARDDYHSSVQQYVDSMEARHHSLQLDDSLFVMRYQNYAIRILPPAHVFRDLVLGFATANASSLIVGVNLVAPEHDPIALRDYQLHMQFFRFLKSKFPDVRVALHAGELRLGQVRPEDLNWHIGAALQIAQPDRIGHGVAIAHESNAFEILDRLKSDRVAVEINLSSNAFILGIEGADHPILAYWEAGVPIVISTDDEGVLRTDMTEQFVLLAYQYPEISYREIKEIVLNSIRYSFMEQAVQNRLLEHVLAAFTQFESTILTRID